MTVGALCAVMALGLRARADDDAAVAAPADTAAPAGIAVGDSLVHLRFPAGTVLPYLDQETPNGWQNVCRAPCDRPLPGDAVYRVRGRLGNPTDSFSLPRASRVDIDASVATPLANLVGPVFAVAGGLALVGGTTLALWPADDRGDSGRGARLVVGVGAIIVGAVTAGVGFLVWHYGSSHATAMPSAVDAPPPRSASKASTKGVQWSGTGLIF